MSRMTSTLATVAILVAGVWCQEPATPSKAGARSMKSAGKPAKRPTRSQVLAEYKRRAATLGPADAEGRYELARYLEQHRFPRTARREARKVLAIDADHAGARRLLGHQKIDGRWLTANRAHEALGHVRYKGRWYTKEEAALRRAADREKLRLKKVQREVNRQVRHLAGPSQKRRVKARDALLAIARKERQPHIAKAARIGFERYSAWWTAYRRAIVEVRATKATLTGLRPRSLSLGTGSQVRIELPELKRASIGTTVGVPIGR